MTCMFPQNEGNKSFFECLVVEDILLETKQPIPFCKNPRVSNMSRLVLIGKPQSGECDPGIKVTWKHLALAPAHQGISKWMGGSIFSLVGYPGIFVPPSH